MVVGLEASGYSTWFIELLESLGHQVLLGDATEIRRRARSRHKTDRRDAELLLDLLLKGEFPRVHQPSFESICCCEFANRLLAITHTVRDALRAFRVFDLSNDD